MCTAFLTYPSQRDITTRAYVLLRSCNCALISHHLDKSDLIPDLLSVFLDEEASETIEFVQPKA